jgi:hypothetical protein
MTAISANSAILKGLVSSHNLNGQQGTVSGRTMNSKGDIRFNVKGPGFSVNARLQNMEWSSILDEDFIAGRMVQGGTPIIAIATIPSGFFMTDMGTIVLNSGQSIRGMSDQELRQLFINCCHVLYMSPVPVQEPGWSEVQRNLRLKCAEIMRAFGLDRLAAQYARMVLTTEPTNVRAREFMPK